MKSFRWSGLYGRFFLFFLVVSFLPILILSAVGLNLYRQNLEATVIQQISRVSDMKLSRIDDYLDERLEDIGELARMNVTREAMECFRLAFRRGGLSSREYRGLLARFDPFFLMYHEKAGYYDVFLIDPDGNIIYTLARENDLGTNLLDGPFRETGLAELFRTVTHIYEPEISGIEFYPPSRRAAGFVASPILEGGRLEGVVAFQINNDLIRNVVTDWTGLGETGEAVAVAASDLDEEAVLMTPLRNSDSPAFQTRYPLNSEGNIFGRALRGERGSGVLPDYRGVETISVWRYVPGLRWGLIVKMDLQEAMRSYRILRKSIGLVTLILFLSVLFLSLLLGNSIVSPIRQLALAARAIGERKEGVRVHVSGIYEIADLGQAFNRMADAVENTSRGLEERVQERTTELTRTLADLRKEIQTRQEAEFRIRLFVKIFESTDEAIVVTDPETRILEVNDAYCRITGYSRDELVGKRTSTLQSGYHGRVFYEEMWSSILKNFTWNGEILDRKKSGEVYPIWLTINAIRNESGETTNYVGIFSDITEMKEAEKKLRNLAYYDTLTGLSNRSSFQDRMKQAIALANRNGEKVGLLLIDLDRFKVVNDTLGHLVGDRLLEEVARRMNATVRESDLVGRLGGDEFVIGLFQMENPEEAARLATRLIREVSRPVQIEKQELYIGASIGISIYPDDSASYEEMVRNADAAMYYAKRSGRGEYHFFTESIQNQVQDRFQIEMQLRSALERNEFHIQYQPQVDLSSRRIVGVEALVRWQNRELGVVPPDRFIPVAEETGQIVPMGSWIFEETIRTLSRWKSRGFEPSMAINVSPRQFHDRELFAKLDALVQIHGLTPDRVEVEITESALMENPESARSMLRELKAGGFRIAMDDFGTGYSSLRYLKEFPVHRLKIDRSFVQGLPHDENSRALVRAILQMTRALEIEVVAEGVETHEQHIFLAGEGCHFAQGYLYGKPVDSVTLLNMLDGKSSGGESGRIHEV